MSEEKRPVYVTTDADLWNSADEAHFFVTKGMVKTLPEVTTPIIEDALVQGLLREATPDEMSKYQFELDVEQAVITRKISAGKKYVDTVRNYQEHLAQEEEKNMVNDTTNDDAVAQVEVPVEEVIVEEPVVEEVEEVDLTEEVEVKEKSKKAK